MGSWHGLSCCATGPAPFRWQRIVLTDGQERDTHTNTHTHTMPPLSVPGCISSAEEFLSPVLFVLPGSRTVPHAQRSSEGSCTDPPQLLTHRPWFSLQLSSLAWIWCPVALGWSDKRFASVCSPQSTLSSLHFLHSTLSQLFPRVKSPGLPSHYKPGPNLGQDLFSSTKVSAVPLNLLR